MSHGMYQPKYFIDSIQQELRDAQRTPVLETSNVVDFLTDRAIGLIKNLAAIPNSEGLSGSNLLVTLIRELDIIISDLLTQNDVDIDFFKKLMKQNAVCPARLILEERNDVELVTALSKLSRDSFEPDVQKKYESEGTANEEVSLLLRRAFAQASRNEELEPFTKSHVVSERDVNMATWFALLVVVYLVVLDLVMEGGDYVTN